MKCDSVEPICTRCQLYGKTCVYTKSRRGGSYKIPPVQENTLPQVKKPSPGTEWNQSHDTGDPDSASKEIISNLGSRPSLSVPTFTLSEKTERPEEDLISSYFEFFNNAHPVVLPRQQLLSRVQSDPKSMEYLIPVINYIGSVYVPDLPSGPYQNLAEEALSSPSLPVDGFSVQALILFALARHCSDEFDIAEKYVDKAIDIALSIDMNLQEFAVANGEGDVILEESWRRTW